MDALTRFWVVSSLTGSERLANMLESDQETWPTRNWCAKEAVGRALGRGIAFTPHSLEVREVSLDGTCFILQQQSGRQPAVKTCPEQRFIMANTNVTNAPPSNRLFQTRQAQNNSHPCR